MACFEPGDLEASPSVPDFTNRDIPAECLDYALNDERARMDLPRKRIAVPRATRRRSLLIREAGDGFLYLGSPLVPSLHLRTHVFEIHR